MKENTSNMAENKSNMDKFISLICKKKIKKE
jgi:hypothetical protein